MIASVRRLISDRDGTISIMAAGLVVALIAFGGLAVDAGSLFYWQRRLQAATDSAVMAATFDPPLSANIAEARLEALGFPEAITGNEIGLYTDDPATPTANRFQTGGLAAPNAVRLNTRYEAPIYLMRLFTGSGTSTVSARAVAYNLPLAGIAIDGGAVDIALFNALFQAASGSSAQLSEAERDALNRTFVPLFRLLDNLAGAQGSNDRTIAQVGAGTTNLALLAASAAAALQAQGGTPSGDTQLSITALNRLAQEGQGSTVVTVSDILAMGAHQERASRDLVSPATDALSVPALPLIEAYTYAAGEGSVIDIAPTIAVPGVGSIAVEAVVGRSIALGGGAAVVAVGPVDSTASSPAARVRVTISLLPISVLGNTLNIVLPLVFDLGIGTATIDDVSCGEDLVGSTNIAVIAQGGVGQAYIGFVDDADLEDLLTPLVPNPAQIITIPLINVSASGDTVIAGSPPTGLDFSRADIAAGTTRSVEGVSSMASTLASLSDDLGIVVQTTIPLPGANAIIAAAIRGAVTPALTAVAPVLDDVIGGLGLRLGYVDVRATSVRCGIPALVN